MERVLRAALPEVDIAIIAHGGVGRLLLRHLRGIPISRAMDHPGEGCGNRFVFTDPERQVLSGWQSIDDYLGHPAIARTAAGV